MMAAVQRSRGVRGRSARLYNFVVSAMPMHPCHSGLFDKYLDPHGRMYCLTGSFYNTPTTVAIIGADALLLNAHASWTALKCFRDYSPKFRRISCAKGEGDHEVDH
ncbi:hypothetical protein A0H81_03369 [Grifola frondosa]|uniref:Uncharacterized protein n=1 Tax=Grifola frondosa TaxID=5627 RepID=A0A1C7MIT5_GRIFR|nr:hypothetical protein A0H81_03369 [Grifola frondosa]